MRAKASSIPTNDIRSFPFDQTEQYHRSANRLGRLAPLGVMTSCHRDQEICGQGCPATCWYCVVSGVARGYVARADGHRQIVDLLLPGDFCGFTAGDEYDCTVDAIVEGTVVAGYPRRRVEMLADQDPQLAREIREVTLGQCPDCRRNFSSSVGSLRWRRSGPFSSRWRRACRKAPRVWSRCRSRVTTLPIISLYRSRPSAGR